jgi:uncharacterized integral membrane protein
LFAPGFGNWMRLLVWLGWSLVFFTLFGFALNNQHVVALHGFFGSAWKAPMVVVVLVAFAAGALLGMLALAPRLWRRSRPTATSTSPAAPTPVNTPVAAQSLPPATRPADPTATDPHGI